MSQLTLNNGDSGLSSRNKINGNFTELYALSSVLSWDMSPNVFPTGGVNGQIYYGTELTTRTTLTDNASPANTLPTKVIAIAMQDNPTTNAHFIFLYPIV